MTIQGWCPLGMNGLISLLSKGLSRVFSSTTVWKHQFFGVQPFLWSNSHLTTGKTLAYFLNSKLMFAGKVMSLLLNMLLRFIMAKEQVSFNFMPAVTSRMCKRGIWLGWGLRSLKKWLELTGFSWLKDVRGNEEAYPRGGDHTCKGPVEGVRGRRKAMWLQHQNGSGLT